MKLTCRLLFGFSLLWTACSAGETSPEPAGDAGSAGTPSASGGASSGGSGGSAGAESGGTTTGGAGGHAGAGTGSQPGGAGAAGGSGTPGGEAGAPSLSACMADALAGNTPTEALELSGDGVRVGLVRYVDPDAFGTSGTTIWLPERFALARNGELECVEDSNSLEYIVSHHNFDDTLTVSGSAVFTLRQLREGYDSATSWTVAASADGVALWGPVALALVSCTTLGTGEDCSARYR